MNEGWDGAACRSCRAELTDTRWTLARARTGDLVFCGWDCLTRWGSDAVNRVERTQMEEMFVQVAADAIRLRHPQAAWLVQRGRIGQTGLTDAALEAAVERLGLWLADHQDTPTGTG